MRRAFFVIAGGIFLCLICCGEQKREARAKSFVKWADTSNIRSGDIIVKRGKGPLSSRIARRMNEKIPFSHCGIVLRRNDSLFVIHSVAKALTGTDGVQIIGFDEFMADCVSNLTYVVRYKEEMYSDNISRWSQEYLHRAVPFDFEINYEDPSRMNCSEFVYWSVLKATGSDVFQRVKVDKYDVLAFNSLVDTTKFSYIHHY